MRMTKIILLTAVAGLLSAGVQAADNPALMAPVKSVYTDYLKIQASLASDSLNGVAANANAIAKAVNGDSMKMLPAAVASQADTLAKAKDLKSARVAFKPLSDSLIHYLAEHHARNAYVQVYCPMADASWLQSSKSVRNPYYGKDDLTCGEIKN